MSRISCMIRILFALALLALPSAVRAQPAPADAFFLNGKSVLGTVTMCWNGSAVVVCAPGGGSSSAPTAVTATARGGTITIGGTDQVLAAANGARLALVIQNPCSATESLFVNLGAAATVGGSANAADLPACGSVTLAIASGLIDREAVHVIAATTGHVFIAKEY